MTVCDSCGSHLQGLLMTEHCHLLPSAQVLPLSLLGGVGLAVRLRFGSRQDAAWITKACWSRLEAMMPQAHEARTELLLSPHAACMRGKRPSTRSGLRHSMANQTHGLTLAEALGFAERICWGIFSASL